MSTAHPYASKLCPVVLVIEDEPGDAALIRQQLQEDPQEIFAVHLADSLTAAKSLIEQQGLRPDVILLDLNLPDSAGIATVERCRLLSNAPVVVMTGFSDSSAVQAAIRSGAEDYLTKDAANADTLRKAIRYAMLRHQRDADARLAATVFTHSREGILITTADGTILDVNDAFTHITGYPRGEALGRKPSLLNSGRQDRAFYQGMWQSLAESGRWAGEIWNRRKNGELYAESLNISAVRDASGKTQQYVGLFFDITERKQTEDEIRQLAFHDPLTLLPNRRLLCDRLNQAMAASKRSACYGGLMFVDLDNFKPLNDTHGHMVGDLLLTEVAARLKTCVRMIDTVARLGGDEFVVLISELDVDKAESALQLGRIAEKIRLALSAPYWLTIELEGAVTRVVEHECTVSIGVTLFRDHEVSQADILGSADAAMYQAKDAGRNRVRFHGDPIPLAS